MLVVFAMLDAVLEEPVLLEVLLDRLGILFRDLRAESHGK